MTVHSVESSPPTKTHESAQHERHAPDRRVETPKHEEPRSTAHAQHTEARGKKLDVRA
jgi:hypothetical protein